ncbi:MAG: hypothetical protein DELT_02038 [Desulfovibrio sp.]
MKLLDLHCDTALKLFEDVSLNLRANDMCVDLDKLDAVNSMAQVFALFVDRETYAARSATCLAMLERLQKEVTANADRIAFAYSAADVLANAATGRKSAILAIEDGGSLEGEMENLHVFYEKGVRIITLTWNYPNEIGFPHGTEHGHKGLTPFGRDLVREMERLGVIPDVSHLSEGGFWDVAKTCRKPFMASHSNCRALADHTRNLDDAQIRALADTGGVMGICVVRKFLLPGDFRTLGERDEGRIEALVAHIKHAENVGGIDVLAIGTDFDGTLTNHELRQIDDLNKLEPLLRAAGYGDEKLEKIYWKNALRVLDAAQA